MMKINKAKPEHEVTYRELTELLNRHASKLTPLEILAVAANMLGKLVAMQDQRSTDLEEVREIMVANIEEGNRQVMANLEDTKGSA
jgi:hypothetical protein